MAQREVSVRISAQDDASAKVAGFSQKLRLMRDSSEDAGRGLGRVGNILGDMSREAIGATGPLGRLGEKLVEFGVGGGIFIAVAGGFALLTKAFGVLTEGTRKAQEAYDKYMESLRGSQSPLAIVGAQLDEAKKKLDELTRGAVYGRAGAAPAPAGAIAAQAAQVANLTAQYDALFTSIQAGARKIKPHDKELERILGRQHDERVAAAGGGNTIGTGGAPTTGGIPSILQGAGSDSDLFQQARAAEAAAAASQGLNESLSQTAGAAGQARKELFGVHEATFAIGEGLQALSGSLLGSIPGFGAVSKAASKAAGLIAKVEGTVAIAKGAVKIAESIFPFNPAGFASGSAMIAEGTKLAALGGGGGSGGGSRGGGGGLAPDQAARNQRELAAARAQRPSVTLKRGYIRTDDPDVQDFFLTLIRNAGGRDSDLSYTG